MINLEKYYIGMNSFGSDLPDNWKEIADYLNDKIIDIINDYCDDGDEYWASEPDDLAMMEREIERVWDDYCMGKFLDAPEEIFERK